MNENRLFDDEPAVVSRQPKTDRLVLGRLLRDEAASFHLDSKEIERAHAIILRWADLERSGRLGTLGETQLQGDSLAGRVAPY